MPTIMRKVLSGKLASGFAMSTYELTLECGHTKYSRNYIIRTPPLDMKPLDIKTRCEQCERESAPLKIEEPEPLNIEEPKPDEFGEVKEKEKRFKVPAMRLRFPDQPHIKVFGNRFNTAALSEVIVGFTDEDGESGGMDSVFIKDLEIWMEGYQAWKSLSKAFADRDVIPDNYNTRFGFPKTPEDKERGYFF